MSQAGNRSSWADVETEISSIFSYPVSVQRSDLVTAILKTAFLGIEPRAIWALRDYDSGFDTVHFRNALEGVYKVNIGGSHLELPDGLPEELIVHVKGRSDEETLAFGARSFRHLQAHGLRTSIYYLTNAGTVHAEADGYKAYFTNHTQGYHPYSTFDDLYACGEMIGRFESAMTALHPDDRVKIRINSMKADRYKIWQSGVAHYLAYGSRYDQVTLNAKDVFSICAAFLQSHKNILQEENGTPCHMDMQRGNILCCNEQGKIDAVLLDCDTMLSGVAPQGYDLGMFTYDVAINQPFQAGAAPLQTLSPLEMIAPVRDGYNKAAAVSLSSKDVAERAMMSAALLLMRVPGKEALGQTEIDRNVMRKLENAARTIAVYQLF